MKKLAILAVVGLAVLGFIMADAWAWGGGWGGGKGWTPPGGGDNKPPSGGATPPAGGGALPGPGGKNPGPGGNRPDPGQTGQTPKEDPAKQEEMNDEFKFELIDDKAADNHRDAVSGILLSKAD